MDKEYYKKKQEKLAEFFDLSHWYGVDCEKCCEVFPKLIIGIDGFNDLCRYECEVCGKTTEAFQMPWLAKKAWNNHEYISNQISIFSIG